MKLRRINNNWITKTHEEFLLVCLIALGIFGAAGFVGLQFYPDAFLGVIGTAFITGLFLYQFIYLKKDTFLHKSIVPGILSGIILAVDYHWFFIILPSILVILFYAQKHKISKILLIIAITLTTLLMMIPLSFYLFVPLSITDSHIYISFNVNAVPVFFLLLGLIFMFSKTWKKAVILVSFPAAFIIYMIHLKHRGFQSVGSQELVPVIAVCSLTAAVGIIIVYRFLKAYSKIEAKVKIKVITLIPKFFLVFAFVLTIVLPVYRSTARENAHIDSRDRALIWIKENIAQRSIILVPCELNTDIASLHQDYHTWTTDFKHLGPGELQNLASILGPAYILVPHWRYNGTDASVKRTVTEWQAFTHQMDVLTSIPGNKIPISNLYSSGRIKNPGFSIIHVKKRRTRDSQIIYVPVLWNNKGKNFKKLCPGMEQRSRYGNFKLQVNKDTKDHFLVVNNTEPDKKGKREITFTYETNRSGFHMEIADGYYLHFIVSASVSPGLLNRSNFIFIGDFREKWEKQKHFPLSQYWQYHLVSKKIRPGSTQLQMGIRFAPNSPDDQLQVRDIKIVVTQKPLNTY